MSVPTAEYYHCLFVRVQKKAAGGWFVRRVLLAGFWWLIRSERKVLLPGG
jgi:hypothetical protein